MSIVCRVGSGQGIPGSEQLQVGCWSGYRSMFPSIGK